MTFINTTAGYGSPVFDYTSRDYQSVLADLVARIPIYLPEWTSKSPNDFGIVLLSLFAYSVDILGYYLDRLAGEFSLATATQPDSIVNLAAMLDYTPTLSIGASVNLQVTVNENLSYSSYPIVIPANTAFATSASNTTPSLQFLTTEELSIPGPTSATPQYVSVVPAQQGTLHTNEQVAVSNGAINQSWPLLNNPVTANSFTVSVDTGSGYKEWYYVGSLINSSAFSQVYTDYVDPNGTFYIVFGDGINGAVPALGSPIICTYQTNSGSAGNVGAGVIAQPVTAVVGLASVTNPASASGGTAAESLSSIQAQAPAALKTLNRAVTLNDVQTLAQQVSGIQWASSVQQTYQLVNLYVAPYGGGQPSIALVDDVYNYMDNLTMANTTVTVLPPTYIDVDIVVNVTAFSNYGNTATQLAVENALENMLSLSNTGFGYRVSLGLVYQTIYAVTGVNYAIVEGFSRIQLTSPLVMSSNYTTLNVQQLGAVVNVGDVLTIQVGGTPSQTAIAAVASGIGATSITTTSFTANSNYAAGVVVQDGVTPVDVTTQNSEIPVAGNFVVNVSGGLIGS